MATGPQPPRPPVPPQPPGSGSNAITIALLIVALVVVVGCIGVWVSLRVISRAVHVDVQDGKNGKEQQVSIHTPLGSLEVKHDLDEASLELPIYPGATQLKNHDSATVNINIADETKVRVVAGKFETSDPLDKVVAFYHDRLAGEVTSFKQKTEDGKTVFEIKHGKQEKSVSLKNDGDKTNIELVRVSEGTQEAN
jgi:hypothetical protein